VLSPQFSRNEWEEQTPTIPPKLQGNRICDNTVYCDTTDANVGICDKTRGNESLEKLATESDGSQSMSRPSSAESFHSAEDKLPALMNVCEQSRVEKPSVANTNDSLIKECKKCRLLEVELASLKGETSRKDYTISFLSKKLKILEQNLKLKEHEKLEEREEKKDYLDLLHKEITRKVKAKAERDFERMTMSMLELKVADLERIIKESRREGILECL